MKFIDSITIQVRAGRGGDGIASFKSSKGKPRLGPDGGDGGTGGDVVAIADTGVNTLSSLRYKAIYKSEDGVRGGPNGCRGRCGEDLILTLPIGTVIKEADTGRIIGELLEKGQSLVIAKGGRHGLGNIHWASSTHQTPEEFRPGALGEDKELVLDLKLIADVGLAGFPNAGKSTLLSRISAARPKIADYPFTTLVPNLGVVEVDRGDFRLDSFVVADVPGLIEGASEGKGLGLQFLKHLERTSLIAYVVDCFDWERSPSTALDILISELKNFGPLMERKRAVIIMSKIDLCSEQERQEAFDSLSPYQMEILPISGVSGAGLTELKRRLNEIILEEKAKTIADDAQSQPTLSPILATPEDWSSAQVFGGQHQSTSNLLTLPTLAP